jgi:ubiquinol oxidase
MNLLNNKNLVPATMIRSRSLASQTTPLQLPPSKNTYPEKTKKNYGYPSSPVEKNDDIIPMSFFEFFLDNINKELKQKRYGFTNDPYSDCNSKEESFNILRLRKSLKRLKLNDKNIWKREQNRDQVECPRIMMMIYYAICYMLDVIYKDKPIERFWFLETVARMPYFSYVSTLQLYETLGWWELDSELKKKHYEEEINETHHLKIMESLGGNSKWWNRFIARHGAMAYYGILMVLFMASPRLAYLSSELLEMHAVDTYSEFHESNKSVLKKLPPNKECLDYFKYAESLYDVFYQISRDEYKHALNMRFVKKLPNRKI